MENKKYHLIVIGGGSGGLVCAAGAAGLGAKVALIEKHKMGGDCLNTGCVPSKAIIRTAKLLYDARTAHRFGLSPSPLSPPTRGGEFTSLPPPSMGGGWGRVNTGGFCASILLRKKTILKNGFLYWRSVPNVTEIWDNECQRPFKSH